jgi:hypothetical protein
LVALEHPYELDLGLVAGEPLPELEQLVVELLRLVGDPYILGPRLPERRNETLKLTLEPLTLLPGELIHA